MGIYDKNGNALPACYDKDGNALSNAYDKDGNVIWSASPVSLKVANYNVGDWYIGSHTYVPEAYKTEYTNLQNDIFTAIDVDLCCMQEAPKQFCVDGTLASTILENYFEYTQWCAAYESSTIPSRTEGSNYAIEDFQMVDFTGSAYSGTTRTYEKFYITVGGKRICIIESHYSLTHSTAVLQNQQMMAAAAGEEYCIIMGDFNTTIHSDAEDYLLTEDYIDLVKPWIDAGYNSANCSDFGVFYTYGSTSWEQYQQGNGYISATDHIFTSPNITIDSVTMNTLKRTDAIDHKVDHMPIVAELTIN